MQATQTRTILRSDELTCPSCVGKIERALARRKGVIRSKVHFATGRVEVHHDPDLVTPEELAAEIRSAGYSAIPALF